MADSFKPTYWVDKSTPAISATNLRKLEKGVADAHGIVDATIGSTGAVDRIVINDGAGHYLKIPNLTSVERDALTPANGMIIYNSTLKCLQTRRDGAWVDIHAGVIRDNLDLGGKKIASLGAPTDDADAATKQYVDVRPASSAIVANAYLFGSSWYRTDPTKPAWMMEVNAISDKMLVKRAPPGEGEIDWAIISYVYPTGLGLRGCVASDEIRKTESAVALTYKGIVYQTQIPVIQYYGIAPKKLMSVRLKFTLVAHSASGGEASVGVYVLVDDITVSPYIVHSSSTPPLQYSIDLPVDPGSNVKIDFTGTGGSFGSATISDLRICCTDILFPPAPLQDPW